MHGCIRKRGQSSIRRHFESEYGCVCQGRTRPSWITGMTIVYFQPRLATQDGVCRTTWPLLIYMYIYTYIYLFSSLTFFFKTLLLCKQLADFNETQFKVFLRKLRILVVVFYAYIAYISKDMSAYILPFNHNSLHCSSFMLRPRDYDVTIEVALLWRVSLD